MGGKYRRLSDGKILTEDEMWEVFQPVLDALTPEDMAAIADYAEYSGGVADEISLEELVYESGDYEIVYDEEQHQYDEDARER